MTQSRTSSSGGLHGNALRALRLARRGKEVLYLFAEGDSPHFRLAGQKIVSDADGLGVDLNTIANGNATVGIVWNSSTIAARRTAADAGAE